MQDGEEEKESGRDTDVGPAPAEIETFKQTVYAFFKEQGRSFLWRSTRDPYAIAVSEFMLQQTRTELVEKKYPSFLEAFPSLRSLAEAPLPDVLSLWKGLGYNRRAVYLKEFAQRALTEWKGEIPAEPEVLQQCRGIGAYTARAICTFAYNLPFPFIETNIRRVFLRHFFPGKEMVRDREILPFVELSLDRENPRDWYYALMDYGAFLGKGEENPNRRSRHFVKQAPFLGSNRQLRGRILSILLAHPSGLPAYRIAELSSFPPGQTYRALQALEKEGFVAEQEGTYRLRH